MIDISNGAGRYFAVTIMDVGQLCPPVFRAFEQFKKNKNDSEIVEGSTVGCRCPLVDPRSQQQQASLLKNGAHLLLPEVLALIDMSEGKVSKQTGRNLQIQRTVASVRSNGPNWKRSAF